ncbi:MAG: DUF853 family protein [Treponemataceae bacterium]
MEKIFLGQGSEKVYLLSNMLNRHGLIAGATGTGKTVTLKVLAESLSDLGIPVFLPDVKGDLFSFCEAGSMNEHIQKRMQIFGMSDFTFKSFPIRVWDFFNQLGIPLRSTVSEMGPLILSKLFNLNETQAGVLNMAFKVADDNSLLLLDIKDLKAILLFLGEHANELKLQYGNISSASIGAIQRSILRLETEGAENFFGEPALDIRDFFIPNASGAGTINILNATKLYQKPNLYAAFLLMFLSEIYEVLPEVGDLDKPKCVFFFDEAHLMFENCPPVLIDKIEQIIRLVRSKGVGIFFVTQNPADIPEKILSQLGNRIQHALRAYTPKDRKAIVQIAMTFRSNPALKIEDEILALRTGEAMVSVLQEDGLPSVTDKVLITSPASKIGTVDTSTVKNIVSASPLFAKYKDGIDRISAHEILTQRFEQEAQVRQLEVQKKELEKQQAQLARQKRNQPKSIIEKMGDQVLTGFSRSVGNQLARGLLGSVKKLLK